MEPGFDSRIRNNILPFFFAIEIFVPSVSVFPYESNALLRLFLNAVWSVADVKSLQSCEVLRVAQSLTSAGTKVRSRFSF
jgi:hypothetical protein